MNHHDGDSQGEMVRESAAATATAAVGQVAKGGGRECQKSALTARIVSASAGSLLTSLLVTPLDVVKVRVQAAAAMTAAAAEPPRLPANVSPCPRGCGTFVIFNGQMDCVLAKSSVPYFDPTSGRLTAAAAASQQLQQQRQLNRLGTFAMIRRIFQQEGYAGIYAGLRPTLLMAVPNTVLYFSAYDEMVYRLQNLVSSWSSSYPRSRQEDLGTNTKNHDTTMQEKARQQQHRSLGFGQDWWIPVVSGGSARLLASSVTAPFEFLRTRQASMIGGGLLVVVGEEERNRASSTLSQFRTIARQEGIHALFTGLRMTLWRDVPFSAIYWLCLEQFRELWRLSWDSQQQQQPQIVTPTQQAGQAFINGAAAGMIAAACTTPFDVLKTRQQASYNNNNNNNMSYSQGQGIPETSDSLNRATSVETRTHGSHHHHHHHHHHYPSSPHIVTCHHDGAMVYEGALAATETTAEETLASSSTTTSTRTMASQSSGRATATGGGNMAQLRYIAETEGLSALWRGNQARMLRVAPACAIMISSYEFGKRILSPSLSSQPVDE